MKKLSSHLQSKIRSTVHIIDFKSAVYELVLNSIDSKAVCISVFVVGNDGGSIEVRDNGISMSYDELVCSGKRFDTILIL